MVQKPKRYRVRIVELDQLAIEGECRHQLLCGFVFIDQKFTPDGKKVILYFAEY